MELPLLGLACRKRDRSTNRLIQTPSHVPTPETCHALPGDTQRIDIPRVDWLSGIEPQLDVTESRLDCIDADQADAATIDLTFAGPDLNATFLCERWPASSAKFDLTDERIVISTEQGEIDMAKLRNLIPIRPTDAEPIDLIPVVIAAGDLAATLGGWAVVGGEALECSEVSVFAAMISNYLNLGAPYVEALSDVTYTATAYGYSLGVVIGADGVSARKGANYFGHRYFPKNDYLPGAAKAGMNAYAVWLVHGYREGRELKQGQKVDLWRDLRHRAETMPGWAHWDDATLEETKFWADSTWRDYYEFFALVFRKYHMAN